MRQHPAMLERPQRPSVRFDFPTLPLDDVLWRFSAMEAKGMPERNLEICEAHAMSLPTALLMDALPFTHENSRSSPKLEECYLLINP
jgi:hypothetical protein